MGAANLHICYCGRRDHAIHLAVRRKVARGGLTMEKSMRYQQFAL
jgi:hypothetical protein